MFDLFGQPETIEEAMSFPWPGYTQVSSSKRSNSLVSTSSINVAKVSAELHVSPTPPGNRDWLGLLE
jgi:hypothetical protein